MTHCTACGATSAPHEERHKKCPACGHIDWNNPVPAVGVAIIRGEQLLLAQRGAEPKKGQWDLVGGFIKPGESAQEALDREVTEETGMLLGPAELIDILPGDYGGRPSINMLYIGKAEGEPVAQDDVAALTWFDWDKLPEPLAWPHEAEVLGRIVDLMSQAQNAP
jgi:NAD+ diphosphatase